MKTIHNQMMQISTLHWTNLVLDFFSPKFKSILVSPLYFAFSELKLFTFFTVPNHSQGTVHNQYPDPVNSVVIPAVDVDVV